MKRNIIFLLSFFLTLTVVPLSYSDVIQQQMSYDEIIYQWDSGLNPLTLDAEIYFSHNDADHEDNEFSITLFNTSQLSAPVDYPAPVMLTGIGFNLLELDIEGGSVAPTSPLWNASGDPSLYWGYDNVPEEGYFQQYPAGETTQIVDTVVSTMTAAVDYPFLDNGNNNYIQGPNYGVLSPAYYNASDPYGPLSSMPYFFPYVEIDVILNGTPTDSDWGSFFNYIDNQEDIVIAFGSPTPSIPEPSTMFLVGFGLIGLGVFGRKKLFKRG